MNDKQFWTLIGFLAVSVYGWPVLVGFLAVWGAIIVLSFIIKLAWWIITMPFKVLVLTLRWMLDIR